MKPMLKIDIVSDVSCPWCIIGYQAFIINDKHLISGGQPVAAFEQALKEIATKG